VSATDGNSEDLAHGGSEDEAAWLDLVGRFDATDYPGDAPAPWPESEDLPSAPPGGASTAAGGSGEGTGPSGGGGGGPDGGAGESGSDGGAGEGGPGGGAGRGGRAASAGLGGSAPAPQDAASAGLGGSAPSPQDAASAEGGAWPARAGQGITSAAGPGYTPPAPPAGGVIPVLPPGNGPFPAPGGGPDADPLEDEHFVPPPPPPLPRLSPAQKGAWLALFGGPGYLLAATLANWSVPGWLAIGAIAAFVGGFMMLVLNLGEDRDRDSGSGSGDGAVV
jgi:hypothetical protein